MLGEVRDAVDLHSALSRRVFYWFCFVVFLMHCLILVFHFLRVTALH